MQARALTKEELGEIDSLAVNAIKLLNENINEDISLLDKLKEFVNRIKFQDLKVDDVNDTAFQLGSLYGKLIHESYGWKWMYISINEDSAYGITSPDDSYCCQVHHYLFKLLTTSKTNNLKLLFNMLKDVTSTPTQERYVFFALIPYHEIIPIRNASTLRTID